MVNFILGIVIIIGGLAVFVATAAHGGQPVGYLLGIGFVIAGALIGSSGRR